VLEHPSDLVVTIGAGDIDQYLEALSVRILAEDSLTSPASKPLVPPSTESPTNPNPTNDRDLFA
jgi:hypothetical protein